MIILKPPLFNKLLGFVTVDKQDTIQQFRAKMTVETLDKGILPRTAWRDVDRLALVLFEPILDGVGNKFRPIVAA